MPIDVIMVNEEPNKQLRLKLTPTETGTVLTPDEAVDVAVELLRAANALDASAFDRGSSSEAIDCYPKLGSFVRKYLPADR